MRVAAPLMPPAVGQRWLPEADSPPAEARSGLWCCALANYPAGASEVDRDELGRCRGPEDAQGGPNPWATPLRHSLSAQWLTDFGIPA